jgi:hypothetical protein
VKLVLAKAKPASARVPLDPRSELIALHQQLFRRQRRLIESSTGPERAELIRYRRRYRRNVRSFERVVSYDEVLREALAHDLVYVGDYHTLRQAQRSYLKLAERLCDRGRAPVLALEFVQGRYQSAVDAHLAGRLSEAEFLVAIRYHQHQAFDVWPNFRPIFELARRRGLRVLAIDRPAGGPRSLHERDAFAARALAKGWRPGDLALILIGELHIAPPHLPAAVDRELAGGGRTAKSLLLYQNCEEIYWALERRGQEHAVEAVRIGKEALCLVNSSPLVCQQSYLDWVEATREGEQLEVYAPAHHFREAALLLGRFLGVDLEAALDSVHIHAAGDLSFITALRRSGRIGVKESRAITRRVLARESFCLPRANAVYLATSSVNHATEVAAEYLWHLCAEDEGDERGLVDSFYARTLEQALGFFGSKVLNPRRKCRHAPQLQRQLSEGTSKERQVAAYVLAHQRLEHGRRAPEVRAAYALRDPEVWGATTRALGQILGDKLYYAMLRGHIAKSEIRELFFDLFEEEGAAFHMYLYLVGKVGHTRVPVRTA